MISTACDPFFRFQIDGHSFTIIEIEGINITPYTVDGVDVFAGQRYSFVLTADKAVNNYCKNSCFLEPCLDANEYKI